ncbi:unnamed protein product, partial [Brassica rapa]
FRVFNGLWACKIGSLSPSGLDLLSRTASNLTSRHVSFDTILLYLCYMVCGGAN